MSTAWTTGLKDHSGDQLTVEEIGRSGGKGCEWVRASDFDSRVEADRHVRGRSERFRATLTVTSASPPTPNSQQSP